ncbi:hypothetical protein AGLY_009906 [Aphis glycines]|uniref:Uncharacterized protein n=1 Tax=Aphis glycines TaxID=307491 RepID=A0A6G0TIG8_APHGL|nr:hypothetical protein AGLY_009906 [Aphis glycines]
MSVYEEATRHVGNLGIYALIFPPYTSLISYYFDLTLYDIQKENYSTASNRGYCLYVYKQSTVKSIVLKNGPIPRINNSNPIFAKNLVFCLHKDCLAHKKRIFFCSYWVAYWLQEYLNLMKIKPSKSIGLKQRPYMQIHDNFRQMFILFLSINSERPILNMLPKFTINFDILFLTHFKQLFIVVYDCDGHIPDVSCKLNPDNRKPFKWKKIMIFISLRILSSYSFPLRRYI